MSTTTEPTLNRLSVGLPPELHAELSAYAAHYDASLGWAVRRACRLLVDEHAREQAAIAALPPKRRTTSTKRKP